MVERYFPNLWRPDLGDSVEITRFCASPRLTPDERLTAVSDLLLGLCRHCQRERIETFFGIVFPAMARALQQAGWPAELLAQKQGGYGDASARPLDAERDGGLEYSGATGASRGGLGAPAKSLPGTEAA